MRSRFMWLFGRASTSGTDQRKLVFFDSRGRRRPFGGLGTTLLVAAMLAALVIPIPSAANAAPPPFDGWKYNATTDHYYKVLDGVDFSEAESTAVGYSGHIVTINDAAEELWICSAFPLVGFGMGYNDIASEGTWVWVSGETPGYTNWQSGEPNNANAGEHIAYTDCPAPSWNDVPSPGQFVIEIPGGPAPVAELTGLSGTVSVSGGAASPGQLIRAGETFVVGGGSSMTMRTGTVDLDANHEIPADSDGTITDNLTLDDFRGQIRTLVQNFGPDAYTITTPISIVGVRGTDTTTAADDVASTTWVDDGTVDVSTLDLSQTVTVDAGFRADVDGTGISGPYVNSPSNHFGVDPQHDWVNGWEWAPNSSVTIQLDDDTDPSAWLNEWSGVPTWGDGSFGFGIDVDVQPGQYVRVFDESGLGYPDKDTQANPLAVADIAVGGTTLHGTGDSAIGPVTASIHGDPGEQVIATFGTPGPNDWTADFAPTVLEPGMNGSITQPEPGIDDGDRTEVWWHAPNPFFNVDAGGNNVWGHEWSPGEVEVTVTGGPTWLVTVSDGSDGQNPGDFGIDLNNSTPTWDLAAGHEVTVAHTTESESKNHIVTELHAFYVPSTNTVDGTAAADSFFNIWVHDTNVWRTDQAVGGVWSIDFAAPGTDPGEEETVVLGPGNNGNTAQCDPDGDCTYSGWNVPNPVFFVGVDEDPQQVWGDQWTPGDLISVTVNGTPYPDVVAVGSGPEDEGTFGFDLFAATGVAVGPGDALIIEDQSGNVKDHTVNNVGVTVIDEAGDIVEGTATPDSWVHVDLHGACGIGTPVDGAGDWSAAFTPGSECEFDIGPGTNGAATEYDPDWDGTQVQWGIAPLPTFSVESHFQVWSTGEGWIEGNTATLNVDDPGNGPGVDYTDTVLIERWGPEPWEVGFGFNTEPFEIHPGFEVTVDDGVTVKDLILEDLTIDLVDEATSTVAGYGPAETMLNANAGDEFGGCGFDFMSEPDGSYVADFSGDPCYMGPFEPGWGGAIQIYDPDGDSTHRGWNIANTVFNSNPADNGVWGHEWSPGEVEVTVTGGPTWLVPVSDGSDGIEPGDFGIDLNNSTPPWDLTAGQEITVSHTTAPEAKDHVVTDLTAGYNGAANTVDGTAAVDSFFDVWVHDTDPQVQRNDQAIGGVWSVDFAVPGDVSPDEDETIVLGPGNNGAAAQCDPEGDCTFAFWGIPDLPSFSVRIDEGEVHGYQWPLVDVTVEIDDPGIPGAPDWTDTLPAEPAPWDGEQTFVQFRPAEGGFTLAAGQLVTMTDGTTTKTHTVTDLAITQVCPEVDIPGGCVTADTYWGTTSSGFGVVNANINDEGGPYRIIDVIGGNWQADFSVPWEDQGTWDIGPGTGAEVNESDADGDSTQRSFYIPNPAFYVGVNEDPQQVWGDQWTPGDQVSVTVNGAPYPDVAMVGSGPEDEGTFGFDLFAATGLMVGPGDALIIEDQSGNVKDHTVNNVAVTVIDEAGDIVEGTATPDSWVHVDIHGVCGIGTLVDGVGDWSVAFTPGSECEFDIGPGTNGAATEYDPDWDGTQVPWGIAPIPAFSVESRFQVWSTGEGWVEGNTATLNVDDPGNGPGVDYTDTVLIERWGPEPWEVGFNFHTAPFEIHPQFEVTVDDGVTVKDLILEDLTIDLVDEATSTVAGHGPADTMLNANAGDEFGGCGFDFMSEPDGSYLADFSGDPCYMTFGPGWGGAIQIYDPDGDSTHRSWNIGAPYFAAVLNQEQIDGWEWTPDDFVHVTVNGTDVDAVVATDENGNFGFSIMAYDLVVGDHIVVEDLATGRTKDHVAINLEVIEVDEAADTVSGLTELYDVPEEHDVFAWLHEEDIQSSATPNPADGSWGVDFMADHGFDLQPGHGGGVGQPDADGDYTNVYWQIPNPVIRADAGRDDIWGHEFAPGPVTVEIPGAPVVYTVDADENGDFGFNLNEMPPGEEYDLVPGDVVTVTDSDITSKSLLVSSIEIHAIDVDNDLVIGWAPPDHPNVSVWIQDEDGFWLGRGEGLDFNDVTGDWTADFGGIGYDIGPGTGIDSSDCDPEDDCTHASDRVPFPAFAVNAVHDTVDGWEWLPNDMVTITFNGTEVFTADTDPNGNFSIGVGYDVVPGDVVEVFDPATTKTHTVYELKVMEVDVIGDTVTGLGPADAVLHVGIDEWGEIDAPVGDDNSDGVPGDGMGLWTADFSAQFDIVDDTVGHVRGDEYPPPIDDGDHSWISWWVANPRIQVNLTLGVVFGGDWPEAVPVSLSVAGKPECADTQTADLSLDRWSMNVEFDMTGCTIVPGDVVTLTDTVTTEVHTVRDFVVTNVDVDNDVVEGSNDIGSRVFVVVWNDGFQETAFRNNLRDTPGDWLADFATPPATEDEGFGVFDIQGDTTLTAGAAEPNANETIVDWSAEPPVVLGMLRVTTSPAVPSQVLVDGVPADTWGLTWVKVPVGDHEISFTDVQGFTTPPPEIVTVTEGATTVVTGDFTPRGWLQVTTSPAFPATIYVDGVPMNDWGVWTDLEPGSYEVCFGAVADYTTPACDTAVVTAGANTPVEGVYVSDPGAPGPSGQGYLRVTTNPAVPAQILIDGIPRDSWGLNWVKLDPGTYEVAFTDIGGFTTPDPITVTITAGDTTVIQGDYLERGWLQVTTTPPVAGTIYVDGMARNDWGMWTDLTPATYEVCFGDVPGYDTPGCALSDVIATTTTTINGTYTPLP